MAVLLKLVAVMVLVAMARDAFTRGWQLAAQDRFDPRLGVVFGAGMVAALVWAVWYLGARV